LRRNLFFLFLDFKPKDFVNPLFKKDHFDLLNLIMRDGKLVFLKSEQREKNIYLG
jgi:hypothetical protein